MKKILFIEPHADDALISCHYALNDFVKEEIYLLTITNSTPKGLFRSSKDYCESINWNFINDNNYIPQVFYKQCTSTYNSIKRKKNYDFIEASFIYKNYYKNYYTLVEERIYKFISEINPQIVVTCIGILHATHVLTRLATDKIIKESKKNIVQLYFLDIPYYTFVSYEIKDLNIIKHTEINNTMADNKKFMLSKYYPSEVYMEDENLNLYKIPEVLYSKHSLEELKTWII